jgi:hypothetical protein
MIFNKKCFKDFGEILKILNYHTFNVYIIKKEKIK